MYSAVHPVPEVGGEQFGRPELLAVRVRMRALGAATAKGTDIQHIQAIQLHFRSALGADFHGTECQFRSVRLFSGPKL